jgi:hypothetical protein
MTHPIWKVSTNSAIRASPCSAAHHIYARYQCPTKAPETVISPLLLSFFVRTVAKSSKIR